MNTCFWCKSSFREGTPNFYGALCPSCEIWSKAREMYVKEQMPIQYPNVLDLLQTIRAADLLIEDRFVNDSSNFAEDQDGIPLTEEEVWFLRFNPKNSHHIEGDCIPHRYSLKAALLYANNWPEECGIPKEEVFTSDLEESDILYAYQSGIHHAKDPKWCETPLEYANEVLSWMRHFAQEEEGECESLLEKEFAAYNPSPIKR